MTYQDLIDYNERPKTIQEKLYERMADSYRRVQQQQKQWYFNRLANPTQRDLIIGDRMANKLGFTPESFQQRMQRPGPQKGTTNIGTMGPLKQPQAQRQSFTPNTSFYSKPFAYTMYNKAMNTFNKLKNDLTGSAQQNIYK